jgi:NAD(P)-dependent dehydrogenase (short-subunit alcohol dehydrogenase family)
LPLTEQEESTFDEVIAVDLKGAFLCLKYEIRHMLGAGGGAIDNTASIAGVIANPKMAPYVAAKLGVIGLTQSAALVIPGVEMELRDESTGDQAAKHQ